jgi:CelD/BcsL family acetyltransferase involved in cellulose biosynthesis
MAQNIRYYTRRAEREGAVTWQTVTSENLTELLKALLDLHTAAWESSGRPGMLADPAVRAFHRAAAPRLLEAGLLRMYGLCLAGRLIGVWYGFFHKRRLYYYLGGFSPKHQHLSPGTLLIAHAIEDALREGAVCLDFLRGEEA